ncbi:glycosyltransferase family 4 protein [Microbacterium sp. Leaf151]|uniref:glycosyltransferase family 4 protein n=1 Tax=Microbacterium sp. Leaf151 TaxID=1736276 RepID=UPI0006F20FFE|nr:glycosyltransferase family 4 protein [Microbacterium sp. Leaf151]KQR23435.1 hypothetical protein ASF76_09620 [Microbacterium sp. Leaf151]
MTATTSARREIFAVGRGQYENVGDVLLRRPLLDWARDSGRLHVYVGASPEGYDEGLGIQPGDVVYRSFVSWYRALMTYAARGEADSLYKPGELQLTLIGMKEHLAMLPAVALVRLRGGKVARIGAGARNFAPLPRALMWPSNALSSYTRWRDDRTAAYLGFGSAMPDLGYSEGLSDDEIDATRSQHSGDRDIFVVSLRDDTEVAPRPYPDAAWMEAVRQAAEALRLRIVVVTQVSVDEERSQRLARDLRAEVVGWPALGAHSEQEGRLREVYRRTAVAASDRLHVIIAAYTEGAMPIGLQLDDSDKISRHFDTIGLNDIAVNTTGMSAQDLRDRLVTLAGRRNEALSALRGARTRLATVRSELTALLRRERVTPAASPATERPVVYHLGRAGDHPGGMTQVVNAYIDWPFERCDVEVLASRGNPGDHLTGLRLFLTAFGRLRRIAREGRPATVVAHLSERGSFVREGTLAIAAARLGLPVIAHLHGSEFDEYEARHHRRVRGVLAVCAHVIALSDSARDTAARTVGEARVSIVPNAVPSGPATAGTPTVLFGGVVSRRKGMDVLDAAWRRVQAAFPDWSLVVAGPVRDSELVDRSLPSASFLGSVPHSRMLELLGDASVAVLPSRDEAMPMFILEALARRVCVVSTQVGGIPDVLGDDQGVLVAPGDVDALVDALTMVMSDEDERDRRAGRGHAAFADTYAAEAVYPRVESIWLAPLGDRFSEGAAVDARGSAALSSGPTATGATANADAQAGADLR